MLMLNPCIVLIFNRRIFQLYVHDVIKTDQQFDHEDFESIIHQTSDPVHDSHELESITDSVEQIFESNCEPIFDGYESNLLEDSKRDRECEYF